MKKISIVSLVSELWASVPDVIKIFFYSSLSSLIGFYLTDQAITVKVIVAIVATNLGLWGGPKVVAKPAKDLEVKLRSL